MRTDGSTARADNVWTRKWSRRIRRWHIILFLYLLIFVIGLFAIELRVGPIWQNGRFVERIPSLAAAFNWAFFPEQMRYVAVSDLKMNHQLQRDDLAFPPTLDKALHDYLPEREDLLDQYLRSDVSAGRPILPQNLSRDPVIEPVPTSFVLGVRLTLEPASAKLLESKAGVVLSPVNSTEKFQGTIVSGRWEKPSPSPANTRESDKNKPEAAKGIDQSSPLPDAESGSPR
jgi:hypothetical protein